MHASRLDTFSKVREEVHDIARAREAAGSVAPMQVGAVKGKTASRTGQCEQRWYLKDDKQENCAHELC